MLINFRDHCCDQIQVMPTASVLFAVGVLDCLGSMVFAKLVHGSGSYMKRQIERMDVASFSLGDYSLRITVR